MFDMNEEETQKNYQRLLELEKQFEARDLGKTRALHKLNSELNQNIKYSRDLEEKIKKLKTDLYKKTEKIDELGATLRAKETYLTSLETIIQYQLDLIFQLKKNQELLENVL